MDATKPQLRDPEPLFSEREKWWLGLVASVFALGTMWALVFVVGDSLGNGSMGDRAVNIAIICALAFGYGRWFEDYSRRKRSRLHDGGHMTYDPICRQCRSRPVMDGCDICEECWYAPPRPQHDSHCHDYRAATGGSHCICGASDLARPKEARAHVRH